jgi:hypothetical protein
MKGARWCVGDGRSIRLLTDNWIPNYAPGSFTLLAHIPDGATVDFLLQDDHGAWDVDVVRAIFEEEVANQVLQIQISRSVGVDFLSWPHTKFGEYTVRSAYNLARSEKFFLDRSKQGGGASSGSESDAQFWKKLWAIRAPGKMKINLWRFAHDCLPTGAQLCRRHIPANSGCIYCNREETAAHAFLFCDYANEVWEEIKPAYNVHLCRSFFTSTKTWLHEFLARSSEKDCMILAVVFWHIWSARNGVRNGELMKHPHCIAEQSKAYVDMIEQHLFSPNPSTRRDTSPCRWSPLPEGTVLINVDAAVFTTSRWMGIGVVIRDHTGNCLTACSELLNEVTMPELAEALALRRAVALAVEEGFNMVRVVTDCLSLVQRLESPTSDRSNICVVCQDIKLLRSGFIAFSLSHVNRRSNVSAHILARSAEQFVSYLVRNSIPDCIRNTLCNVAI